MSTSLFELDTPYQYIRVLKREDILDGDSITHLCVLISPTQQQQSRFDDFAPDEAALQDAESEEFLHGFFRTVSVCVCVCAPATCSAVYCPL